MPGYEYFVEQGYDTEESYRASRACDPNTAAYTATFYDNAYDGYSEPGTSTVQVMMLSGYEPWKRFENDYFAGRKDAYRKEKERIAQTLIKKAEESVLPGLSSMISVMDAATPLTNFRYTGNPQGAIYGFEQTVANTYMYQIGNVTPFPGLYVSSAWSSGGGYMPTIASGLSTATRLLKDFGHKKS